MVQFVKLYVHTFYYVATYVALVMRICYGPMLSLAR